METARRTLEQARADLGPPRVDGHVRDAVRQREGRAQIKAAFAEILTHALEILKVDDAHGQVRGPGALHGARGGVREVHHHRAHLCGCVGGERVSPEADQGVETRASFLRKTFALDAVPADAILRISALGLYRAFINGKRVGHDQLTPGWTVYDHRLSYQTYDVAGLLKPGENVIDIWLGDGWLRSQMGWAANPVLNTWGKTLGAIAQISNSRRAVYGYDQRIEAFGSKGMLQAGNQTATTVSFSGEPGVIGDKPLHFFLERYDAAYRVELQHFIDCVLGKAKPATSIEDGRNALALAEAAVQSLKTGAPVKV